MPWLMQPKQGFPCVACTKAGYSISPHQILSFKQ